MNSSLKQKLSILEFLRPKPSPCRLLRIGGSKDGAYLVPDDLFGISRCFSPGCKDTKSFEDELSSEYGIQSHLCDFTATEAGFSTSLLKNQTFEQRWLAPVSYSTDEITLEQWVSRCCDDSENQLFLQMDIEGSEYPCLLLTNALMLSRFRIIVVEFHNLQKIEDQDYRESVLSPLFKKLGKLFTCVHLHPNNCSSGIWVSGTSVLLPLTLEVTLLRKDRFSSGHAFSPCIPHPLDISNIETKDPLHLSGFWKAEKSAVPTLLDRLRVRLS